MWIYCIFCEIHAGLKCVWGDILICPPLLFVWIAFGTLVVELGFVSLNGLNMGKQYWLYPVNEHNLGKTSVNDRHFQTTPSFCMGGSVINFSRSQLINLRYESNFPVSSRLLALLKSHMLLKYRGSRAGKTQRIRQIFVQAGHRISYKRNYNRYADFTNLPIFTVYHYLKLTVKNRRLNLWQWPHM
jgi:hypothetical protein